MSLITLDVAKDHLGITWDDENDRVERMVAQAETLVIERIKASQYTDEDFLAEVDAWDEDTVPADVQAGILQQLSELHRFRGDEQEGPKRLPNDLSEMVRAMLGRWIDPTVV